MKKFIAMMLVGAFVLATAVGCGDDKAKDKGKDKDKDKDKAKTTSVLIYQHRA
jgi:hypothetical protein